MIDRSNDAQHVRRRDHGRPKDVSSPKSNYCEWNLRMNVSTRMVCNTYQQDGHILFCSVHHPEPH